LSRYRSEAPLMPSNSSAYKEAKAMRGAELRRHRQSSNASRNRAAKRAMSLAEFQTGLTTEQQTAYQRRLREEARQRGVIGGG
jgi:hypothetical protein